MKGVETPMRKVLEGTKQFVIPAYQRPYAWSERQWSGLWKPILAQYSRRLDGPAPNPYFVGSLVMHQREATSSAISKFDVIDGQQRLTTTIVLLAALRDVTRDSDTSEAIDEQILRNKFGKGDDRLKLLPKASDNEDMWTIVLDRSPGAGRINLAYNWFHSQISTLLNENPGSDETLLQAVLDGLILVEISASEGDNPHRIFQTLNSTGVGLSEVDKLRSHFFMLLPNDHEEAHSKFWRPMEDALPGSALARFLWVDLVSRGGGDENTKSDAVYDRWQQKLQQIEDSEIEIVETLKDLKWRSNIYQRLTAPKGTGPLDAMLARIVEWGTNVHQPLTHRILVLEASGGITQDEALQALRMVEAFLVRRMLVGHATNNLNRIFTTIVGQIAGVTNGFTRALYSFLSEKGKYWPTDLELREDAVLSDFATTQRSAQRYFVLRRIEESMAQDGFIDWSSANFTLEHFMPQNLNKEWIDYFEHLGVVDPVTAHYEAVHTIGNVTLTSLNSKLSDSPLQRKQQILAASKLAINEDLIETDSWGPAQIAKRSASLVEAAIEIWLGPDEEVLVDSTDFSEVDAALSSLDGSEWTSVAQLVEVSDDASERAVIDHLNDVAPAGSGRVLTGEGLPDVRLHWVRDDLPAFRDQLVGLGVFGSTREESADMLSFVSATRLAERIELE